MYTIRKKNSEKFFIASSAKVALVFCTREFDLDYDDFTSLLDFLLDGHLYSSSVELSSITVIYDSDD